MTESPVVSANSDRWALGLFGGISALAFGLTLWLGRFGGFWHDECDFLHHRSLADPLSLFVPHNDHPVILPALLYRLAVNAFGTDSYLPFLAMTGIAHVVTALGLFALLRRRSLWLALSAGILFLFLGSGSDNLFWAFQITFVGSTAFGVWALWAADRDNWPFAAILIVGSLSCSLVGVPFLIAAAAIGFAGRDRRAFWLALPAASLLIWWLAFGLGWERPPDWATVVYGSPADLESWALVPAYAVTATAKTFAGIIGTGYIGAGILAVWIAWTAASAWAAGRAPSRMQVGAIAGYAVFIIMTGVIRAPFELGFFGRHLYIAALFVLLALPRLRWGGRPKAVATALVTSAIIINVAYMATNARHWETLATSGLACIP